MKFLLICMILFFSTVSFSQEFLGTWSVSKKVCERNDQQIACKNDYSTIQLSTQKNPEILWLKSNFSTGGFASEPLYSFDYSDLNAGVIYKGNLNISSDGIGATYSFADGDQFARKTRSVILEKATNGYVLTELYIEWDLKTHNIKDKARTIYFLAR